MCQRSAWQVKYSRKGAFGYGLDSRSNRQGVTVTKGTQGLHARQAESLRYSRPEVCATLQAAASNLFEVG